MIISPVTYDYYEISFILIVAAFSIPISRKASMVYIPVLIVMGLIFGPLLGFINHSFAIYMLSSFATIGVGMLGLVIILYYESHNFSPRILKKYFTKIAALDTIGMVVTAVGAGIFFSLLTGAPFIVGFIFGSIIYASVSFVVLISIILQTVYVPYVGKLLLGESQGNEQ